MLHWLHVPPEAIACEASGAKAKYRTVLLKLFSVHQLLLRPLSEAGGHFIGCKIPQIVIIKNDDISLFVAVEYFFSPVIP